MSSWARFSSRGGSSYRGGGGGSFYRGLRGENSYRGSRGGFSSSSRGRGGFSYKYDTSSARYSSIGASGGRYASQSHIDDYGSFRNKSYRIDTGYGSGREHSHRGEGDLSRKRMRSDSYSQSQGSISRRSHEVEDYRGGGGRYPTYSEARSGSYGESRSVYKKPRTMDYRPKEDYRRKEMPPPLPPKSRTQFRGRVTRGRGGIIRRGDSFLARKRSSAFSSEVRRTASELLALRRARILKMKSLREQAVRKASSARLEKKKKENKEEDEPAEKTEKVEVKEGEKSEEKKVKKEKKKEEGEIEEPEETEKSEKEEEKPKKEKEEAPRTDFFGNPFLKLECPHCHTKCVTFKEYAQHLYQPKHVRAMRDKSIQLKGTLAKMRVAQRTKQKETEEEDLTSLNARTVFCPICKLNYSQDKSIHQSSEAHKKMKNFLLPYCRICRLSYKSPMMYESHICSLEHIKRKHKLDLRLQKSKSKGSTPGYLDNFMVLDSVGSGDEADENKEEDGAKKKEETEENDEEDDENLGVEFIHRVAVFYCEVCCAYLPRLTDHEKVLRVHCRTKHHLRCYLKFGNDDLLKKMTEDEKEDKEKDVKEEVKDELNESKTKDIKNLNEESVEDEVIDDKLWADVGDLLNQVEPETKSDDDEEEEGGRYDRFKSVEKKESEELPAAATEEKLPNGEVQAVAAKEGDNA